MLEREDLEALHPVTLAVLCKKLADVSSDVHTVEKSRKLANEWALLQTPPSTSLKQEQQKDAQRWDLRKRMIDFLEGRDEVDFYPKR